MTANSSDSPAISDQPAEQAPSGLEDRASTIAISPAEISQEVGNLLRTDVVGGCEARYTNGDFSCTFAYNLQVDGQNINQQEHELTVRLLTSLSEAADDAFMLAQPKELIVVLPREEELVRQVTGLLQMQRCAAGAFSPDEADLASLARQEGETRRAETARTLDEVLIRARYGTCLQDVTSDARMAGGGGARLEAAVGIMAERSYAFLSALKSPFSTETIYAESLHASEGVDGVLPLYCMLALQEVRAIQADGGSCTVGGAGENSLVARLTGGKYGWPSEAARQAVGVLAANGRIECTRDGKRLEGAPLALALAQDADLGEVKVRPTHAIHREQLQALKHAFHKATGLDVDTSEGANIVSSFQDELQRRLSDARRAHDRVQNFPFAASYEAAVSELAEMAGNNRDWFEERAPKEAGHIHDLLERIRSMASFATGKDGETFAEAHAFLTEQATNLSALPTCKEGVAKLRELITDPDCYRHPGAADEVRSLMGELQGHVEAGITAARAEAHMELYGFERQFHQSAEYTTAGDEARQKADALLKSCADEIDASTQILAIQAMVDDFKEHNGARLYSYVAPEASVAEGGTEDAPASGAEDAGPRSASAAVTYRAVARPEGWTRTLSTEKDVDEFVAALAAQLKAHVAAGEKIIV